MNDILNIIPYLAIYSIIPSIFILNQSAKYRSFKKALPSVIVAWICYSFIVSIDMLFSQFFIVTIIFTIGIVELIFLIYILLNIAQITLELLIYSYSQVYGFIIGNNRL